ncbi:MAG: peptide/nickel transport system permease protein [Saliniramus fredricksonii]|uniref:Peptide/nickel transport system permease protein n=1 Tax=Saliniramus fredricksonii TaxID=1653334 RepID=A0A0P7XAI0_9HYPH|nr:ABC transporter permease [Saliniramus fredricksonii]KPQ12267.1 MAG: peptide/nickel transport system permease protein [Saliniramus fredricksonii]SCC78976.1 peptide/nickel transport system permease protein [Saliniramus fredricksonii]
MLAYTAKRLIGTVPVLLLITLLVFAMMHAAPGDPATMLVNEEATPEEIAEVRARWGLDQPMLVQYLRFIAAALTLDFGESFRYGVPVAELIAERFPATLELAVYATLIAVIIAVPLGVWAGSRPNSWIDSAGSFFGFFGISMPNFWMAIMLILLVAGTFNLLPSSGRATWGIEVPTMTGFRTVDALIAGNWPAFRDAMAHLLLPAFVLGINMTGILMRITRSSIMEQMNEDYIMTARAKGLSGRLVLWRHGLRNALVTIITIVGLEFGALLSGSIIVETIFAWPGIGALLLQGLGARDYPLITGVVMVYTLLFIFVNLLVDILYASIDPRINLDR